MRIARTRPSYQACGPMSCSTGSAPRSKEALREKMHTLHPSAAQGSVMPALPQDAPVVICKANEFLARHLKRICNGSGPGGSGMTFDHLRVMVDDQVCLSGLACLFRDMVNDRLDGRFEEYLLCSRGLGIAKKGPPGSLRPISIGEACYRAAASFALYPLLRDAAEILQPINFGCGTEGGAEIVVHIVEYSLRTRDVACFVADFSNAFNTVNRARMMAALLPNPSWPSSGEWLTGRTASHRW